MKLYDTEMVKSLKHSDLPLHGFSLQRILQPVLLIDLHCELFPQLAIDTEAHDSVCALAQTATYLKVREKAIRHSLCFKDIVHLA